MYFGHDILYGTIRKIKFKISELRNWIGSTTSCSQRDQGITGLTSKTTINNHVEDKLTLWGLINDAIVYLSFISGRLRYALHIMVNRAIDAGHYILFPKRCWDKISSSGLIDGIAVHLSFILRLTRRQRNDTTFRELDVRDDFKTGLPWIKKNAGHTTRDVFSCDKSLALTSNSRRAWIHKDNKKILGVFTIQHSCVTVIKDGSLDQFFVD